MESILSPAQQKAYHGLTCGLRVGSLFTLWGGSGTGKTTVLRKLHSEVGGRFITIGELVDAMRSQHPLAVEEAFSRIILDALAAHDTVIVDDLDLVTSVVNSYCSQAYPRHGWVEAALAPAGTYAIEQGKKLVFGGSGSTPGAIRRRAYSWGIHEFTVEDYAFFCRQYLPPAMADALDFKKIYRFAPNLSAQQLKASCVWLRQRNELDTEGFIDYLRSQHLTSNVDLGEVQRVDLRDLKGVDEVIRSLEANIVLPLEDDDLAEELDLKPKRGVLLAGPPGTGKTTVGRALAHRLKGKFFLIDGTFISGTGNFYAQVSHIFQAATENAPSVIFIDDSDVIFESGEESGLYRYLLTMLDGLESEDVGKVCVMLTAMDVGNLPPALLRSGRVELWLEMSLPNEHARREILREHAARLPASVGELEVDRLVAATEGFTGADLKRLIEDGKLLLAYDRAKERPRRAPTEYFLDAVRTVQENRERYAQAAERARRQRPTRPPWFAPMAGAEAVWDGEPVDG